MTLRNMLCTNFCAYYKPGKNEDLACRGYAAVERLIREGRRIDFRNTGSRCGPADTELMARKLCSVCDFRTDGCDFVMDRRAPACGGFLLLSQLAAEGRIAILEIP